MSTRPGSVSCSLSPILFSGSEIRNISLPVYCVLSLTLNESYQISSNSERFVESSLEFLDKWGFNGLDLDWEYPMCWQVDCKAGPRTDRDGLSDLVTALSAAFRPRGLLLTAAVSPSKTVIDLAYDVPLLNSALDIINVMTYDYHGYWDGQTGHLAPLYMSEGDASQHFNANYSLEYWVSLGADRRRLVMGLPLYGQTFTLPDTLQTGLSSPSLGRGQQGQFTRADGFLAYYEICHKVREEGWTVGPASHSHGPYAFSGDQWVGFDDVSMVQRKAEYIKENQLGGAMVWALDLDDFSDLCECGKYPLLRTVNSVLRDDPDQLPQCPQHQTVENLSLDVTLV